jgi:hypothetical protein
VAHAWGEVLLEQWAVEKKGALFEKVFGLAIRLEFRAVERDEARPGLRP